MPRRYPHIEAVFVSDAVFAEYAPAAKHRGAYRDQTNVDIDVDCVTGLGRRGVDRLRHHPAGFQWQYRAMPECRMARLSRRRNSSKGKAVRSVAEPAMVLQQGRLDYGRRWFLRRRSG